MKLDDWKDIQFVKSAWFILHSEFQASTLHIEREILMVKKERHTHPQIKILVLQN